MLPYFSDIQLSVQWNIGLYVPTFCAQSHDCCQVGHLSISPFWYSFMQDKYFKISLVSLNNKCEMIAIHTLLEPVASQFMLRTLTMTHILFSFQKTMRKVITNNDNDWISIPVIAPITEIVNIMCDQHCSNSKQDCRRRTQHNISNKQVNNKNSPKWLW